MRFSFMLLCFLACTLTGIAQNEETSEATVSGTVVDESGTPMPGASVSIYNSSVSEVVTGASAGQDGSYSIRVQPGRYVVKITFVSFAAHTQEVNLQAGERYDMGTVTMQPTTQSMDEVVVRGEESQMELQFDKRVFKVGQDLTSLGGSALNVLNNVPSISTDIDGTISLRGNESVRVLINGRQSNMVSNGVDALRSIPASMIKEVEIITNPSSRFAAEGSGGIINIILKKDQRLGLNGNVGVGSGYPQEHELSTNANYRTPKVNLFFSGSIDYRSDPESGRSFQRFAGPDTSYMYREVTQATEREVDGNIRVGADFYLSDNEILTASSFISLEREMNDERLTFTDLEYRQGAFDSDVLQQVVRDNDQVGNERDLDLNLQYENKINGDEHKLVAQSSFEISSEFATNDIDETVQIGGADPLFQRTEDGQQEQEFRVDVEYTRPLGAKGKLETGIRSNTEWTDNSYVVEELEDGRWMPLDTFSGDFKYLENVNAAYAILGLEAGKFSGQLGVRAENTRIRTEIEQTGEVNNQNYYNLFPSIFLNYALTESNSIQLSYSRRLSRPWSRALLPFSDYSNSRRQFIGNPDLTPEFSNSYEAGYLRNWGTGSLLTSFYYRYRTDVIERITQQTEGVLRRFPINLSTERAWGVEFSLDQDLFNMFTLTGNANFFRSESEGTYFEQSFMNSTQVFQSRAQLRWNISDSWKYQASARYQGPRQTTQGSRNGNTTMDSGLSKEFMGGSMLLSLNVRDVFNSQNFNSTVTTDGNPNTLFFSRRRFRWSTRSYTFNLRYFFGSGTR